MRICIAQTGPVKGDIQQNISKHYALIELSACYGADVIIFPELSLTGYEPRLAKKLAFNMNDTRLDTFQKISNRRKLTLGIGIPSRHNTGICISMLLFQPNKEMQVYSKKYLHPDEEAYFIPGEGTNGIIGSNPAIALAICYEIAVPSHLSKAVQSGASCYVASVAKSESGVKDAVERLSRIARQYSMTVCMSNSVGSSEGFTSAGRSSIWNHTGILVAQLNERDEGILLIDTETNDINEKYL